MLIIVTDKYSIHHRYVVPTERVRVLIPVHAIKVIMVLNANLILVTITFTILQ